MSSNCANHQICKQNALKTAEEYCSQKGLRLTDLRRQVLELVWASHQPVKAYDLMSQLPREGDAPAQPPTVYRTLDFLRDHGLIHRLDSLNAYIGCSHPNHHDECYFLLCQECGQAEECCTPDLKKAIINTSKSHGFDATATTLEITGLCHLCRKDTDARTTHL